MLQKYKKSFSHLIYILAVVYVLNLFVQACYGKLNVTKNVSSNCTAEAIHCTKVFLIREYIDM